MGADFMYAVAPIWKVTDERKTKLKQVISNISKKDIVENLTDDGDELENREIEGYKNDLFNACIACEELSYDTRETSDMMLPGMTWRAVITGGLSWGDNPTDAFGPISMVSKIKEVFELLKQWSIEDHK